MNEETKIKARILAGKDPKFREFLKRHPKIADKIYTEKVDIPDGIWMKAWYFTAYGIVGLFTPLALIFNLMKSSQLYYQSNHSVGTNSFFDSNSDNSYDYDINQSYSADNIGMNVNPATGLMTSSYGGVDAGGNAYGTNNHW